MLTAAEYDESPARNELRARIDGMGGAQVESTPFVPRSTPDKCNGCSETWVTGFAFEILGRLQIGGKSCKTVR